MGLGSMGVGDIFSMHITVCVPHACLALPLFLLFFFLFLFGFPISFLSPTHTSDDPAGTLPTDRFDFDHTSTSISTRRHPQKTGAYHIPPNYYHEIPIFHRPIRPLFRTPILSRRLSRPTPPDRHEYEHKNDDKNLYATHPHIHTPTQTITLYRQPHEFPTTSQPTDTMFTSNSTS